MSIGSCQSAATSEIVKRCWSWVWARRSALRVSGAIASVQTFSLLFITEARQHTQDDMCNLMTGVKQCIVVYLGDVGECSLEPLRHRYTVDVKLELRLILRVGRQSEWYTNSIRTTHRQLTIHTHTHTRHQDHPQTADNTYIHTASRPPTDKMRPNHSMKIRPCITQLRPLVATFFTWCPRTWQHPAARQIWTFYRNSFPR